MNLNDKPLKLHLGCGSTYLPDYVNIDLYEQPDTSRGKMKCDLLMDITRLNEYVKKDSVDKILMVHVLEHFTRWRAVKLLGMFYELLKTGGMVEMEHPDLDGVIEFYLNSDKTITTPLGELNMGFTQFYGNQWDGIDYETHRYVWTKRELKQVCENIGFKVVELNNKTHSHLAGRDMRIVLQK